MNAAPNLPTPNLVRAALAAWAEEMDARVLWDVRWPTHPDDPDLLPGNFVGVLPRDVEEAEKTGVLRVYPIGPSEADDPDGDGAAAFADDLWDALADYGWFVLGTRIPFEPIYIAVRCPPPPNDDCALRRRRFRLGENMSKKNKMIQMIDQLEAFMAGLPVGFAIESFFQTDNGVTLTLSAPTVGALKDVAPKVKTENGYYADTILHSAAAGVYNGETNYSLLLQFVERFGEFALVFEGRTGVQSPGTLPLGVHAYWDGKHKPYGLSADTGYTFHVHPAHLVAFEHWTDASGVEVLRAVEREADEVA